MSQRIVLSTCLYRRYLCNITEVTNRITSYVCPHHTIASMLLPRLYKYDNKGKKRYWEISCSRGVITTNHGVHEGKQLSSERSVVGKNIGKVNETSARKQAILECRRMWTKKLDSGYAPDEDDEEGMEMYNSVVEVKKREEGCNVNASKAIGKKSSSKRQSKSSKKEVKDNYTVPECIEIHPMLAPSDIWQGLPKQRAHFDFDKGVYVQPKLDGTRALFFLVDGKVAITSRTGKQYPWLAHLREQAAIFLDGYEDVVLDGELYVHVATAEDGSIKSDSARFQFLQEMNKPRRGSPHPVEGQLQYHIFDVVDPERKQRSRFRLLERMFAREQVAEQCDHLVFVRPQKVYDEQDIQLLANSAVKDGYEGIILRAHDCPYTTKAKQRCLKMRKLKVFDESEFEIVDVVRDEGKDECYFCYVCSTESGKTFKAASMGTMKERRKLWSRRKRLIGKMLTVTYQGVSKDGKPRFPKGKGVRNESDL